jgi:hypothetical protein
MRPLQVLPLLLAHILAFSFDAVASEVLDPIQLLERVEKTINPARLDCSSEMSEGIKRCDSSRGNFPSTFSAHEMDDLIGKFKRISEFESQQFFVGGETTTGIYSALSNISIYIGGKDTGGHLNHDGMLALLCHEIGHRLGKWPSIYLNMAADGQADYWAASRCLPKVFANDDNVSIVKNLKVPAIIQKKCSKSYLDSGAQALCQGLL